MNYTELRLAVQSYLGNTFPQFLGAGGEADESVDQLNRFIQQAELRIYQALRFTTNKTTTDIPVAPGVGQYALPLDFIEMDTLALVDAVGVHRYLLVKDEAYIRQAYPNPATVGEPRFYALRHPSADGSPLQIVLGPAPAQAFTGKVRYTRFPETIVTAGTTWVSEQSSDALLYGTLVEAYAYMKGEQDLLQLYEAKYKEAMLMLRNIVEGTQRTDNYRTPYRGE